MSGDGSLYMVRCCVCSEVDGRDRLLAPKWNTLCKHEGRCKAKRDMLWKGVKKGDTYIVQKYRYQAVLAIFSMRKPATMLQLVNTF